MGEILKILRGLESTPSIFFVDFGLSSEPRIKTTRDFLNNQFADLFLSPKHHQSGSQTQVEVYLRDMKKNKTLNLPTKNPLKARDSTWKPTFFREESFNFEIFSQIFWIFSAFGSAGSADWVSPRWSLTAAGASWADVSWRQVFSTIFSHFHRDFLHFNGLGSSKPLQVLCVSWRWDSGVKHANLDAI